MCPSPPALFFIFISGFFVSRINNHICVSEFSCHFKFVDACFLKAHLVHLSFQPLPAPLRSQQSAKITVCQAHKVFTTVVHLLQPGPAFLLASQVPTVFTFRHLIMSAFCSQVRLPSSFSTCYSRLFFLSFFGLSLVIFVLLFAY
jgi:hypothetical protein